MEKETLPPYPPSWLDWLIARIGRLPGPPWIFYLAVMVILALVSQTLRWLEGSEQVGVFNIARLIETPIWCRSGCISLGTPAAIRTQNLRFRRYPSLVLLSICGGL